MYQLIYSCVKATFNEFSNTPFDFTQNEREAQYCLFEKVKDTFQGSIIVKREEIVPPFENMNARRVRVEHELTKGFIPDIVIFKENINNTAETSMNDVDAFIEVKSGWKCRSGHFSDKKFTKDISRLMNNLSKGFLYIILAIILSNYRKKVR